MPAAKTGIELKGEMDKSTMRAGEFNTPLSVITRTNRKSVRTQNLKKYLYPANLTGICRLFHVIHSSRTIFTKRDHIWGNKTNLEKVKRSKII